MADSSEQNFANHSKFAPIYHFVLAPLTVFLFVWTVVRLFRAPSPETELWVLAAVVLLVNTAVARSFPLKVQDRIIRLEEQDRMRRLLPADLQARVNDFTAPQLIALRFASDAELPELARKVLGEKITDRKVIKQLITQWRADHFRV